MIDTTLMLQNHCAFTIESCDAEMSIWKFRHDDGQKSHADNTSSEGFIKASEILQEPYDEAS